MNQKEKVKIIRKYHKLIQEIENKQSALFEEACVQLRIDPQGQPQATALFDHLYNGTSKAHLKIARLI